MHESSKNLQACLGDMYDQDWYGKDEVDSVLEVWNALFSFVFHNLEAFKSCLCVWESQG